MRANCVCGEDWRWLPGRYGIRKLLMLMFVELVEIKGGICHGRSKLRLGLNATVRDWQTSTSCYNAARFYFDCGSRKCLKLCI